MKQLNVVDLNEFKELKETRKSEETYGRYLKSLGNTQLEIEVNHLLEEFSNDDYGNDFFSKVRMSLKEISSRASGQVKAKIELINNDTLNLF